MKRIINKKVYNTDTATFIAETSNGLSRGDFNYIERDLYKTKKGQYFISYFGGANTEYAEYNGNTSYGGEGINLISDEEAYRLLEEYDELEAIEKYFGDEIEEG